MRARPVITTSALADAVLQAVQYVYTGDNPPASAAWGYCDRDYPREAIVSPYPFKSAQQHYAALLAGFGAAPFSGRAA